MKNDPMHRWWKHSLVCLSEENDVHGRFKKKGDSKVEMASNVGEL